jgi:hypothetical protein
MDAGVDLPAHQALHGRLVERAAAREGSYESRPDASPGSSHLKSSLTAEATWKY